MSTDASGPHSGQKPSDERSAAARCRVEAFPLGPFETNCYIVYPEGATGAGGPPGGSRPCWIVDASFDPWPMIDRVRELGLKPELLILTHAHVDHIAGVNEVLSVFPGLPVVGHEAERAWLTDPALNLGAAMGMMVTARGPDRTVDEGDTLSIAGRSWRVFHTPGHSPGSITLYDAAGGVALVGDTLFAGSVGRTDFPGSSAATLADSIRTKLYTLPDSTKILPGHGPATTVGAEKRSNPFVPA